MNTLPDSDLRPSARARQRDELIAIVENESGQARTRRVLVPVAAAAAIVLVAGAALAVPAFRDSSTPAPAGQVTRAGDAPPTPVAAAVVPLSDADLTKLGKDCGTVFVPPRLHVPPGRAIEGFRAVDPPEDAAATRWVVAHTLGMWVSCGYDTAGQRVSGTPGDVSPGLFDVVRPGGFGSGTYTKSVARITVTPLGRRPVEAALEHGFYYAAVSKVRVRGPRDDTTPVPYVVRGYAASGKLIYTSPRTDGEVRARSGRCYLDPSGKTVAVWMSDNPHPDPKTCHPTYAWSWLPN